MFRFKLRSRYVMIDLAPVQKDVSTSYRSYLGKDIVAIVDVEILEPRTGVKLGNGITGHQKRKIMGVFAL